MFRLKAFRNDVGLSIVLLIIYSSLVVIYMDLERRNFGYNIFYQTYRVLKADIVHRQFKKKQYEYW